MSVATVLDILREAFIRILLISGPALLIGDACGVSDQYFSSHYPDSRADVKFCAQTDRYFLNIDSCRQFYAESFA